MGTTWSFFLLALLLTLSSSSQAQPQPLSFAFSSFDSSNYGNFTFSTDAKLTQDALQITPDSINNKAYLVNKSGRVLFNRPFNLWQPAASATLNNKTTANLTASFNTTFAINIFHQPDTVPGEGFAFVIAPTLDGPPADSYGQYLGLTNSTLDGNASNHIVAVEFDTVKQPFDPDDNHVGLDINSVRSSVATSLTPFGIRISPENGTNYTVWIDYDGVKKHIQVYMALQNQPKPAAAVLNSSLDLSLYVLQQSYFGFAASTGAKNIELNCILAWNLTIDDLPSSDKSSKGMAAWELGLAIALPLVAAMVISGVLTWYCYVKRRKVEDDHSALAGTLRSLPGTPMEFEFKVLRKATNNFDERLKLGQGGFGTVYKGVIPGENTEVAVKKFSRKDMKGQDDFLAELSIINRLRHKHLVRLRGWCHKNGMLQLVYDYMPNGSLDQHLYCGPDRPILTWDHRYNILNGVASALHYLHNEYDQKVVHRDLKASNVLLDSNFNARLGDFGLARALDTDKTSYIDVELGGVAGTMGYIAPECFHTGKATSESDVFGYGAVVLEVVCGRRPRCDLSGFQFLADWVWKLHREDRILDAVDARLDEQFVRKDAVRLLLLGLACTHPLPKERPKTAAILQIISRSVPPPVVPPFKPAFVWPSGPVDDEGCTGSVTSTIISSPYGSSAGWTPRVSDSFKT